MMNHFSTKKENIVDKLNGYEVKDPYRWLEDQNNPEVKEWVIAQNEHTSSILKDNAFRIFSEELARNFKVTNFSNPVAVHGKYFYLERRPDEDQFVLYVKNGLDGESIVLFDPNGRKEGNTVSIDYWFESQTGKYVAFGVSEDGDEMATLYIKDTETNTYVGDPITHCRYSTVAWLPDDSGFFYTRNARPGTVPKDEEHLHVKVYLHHLGGDSENDELIFGADRPKDDMIAMELSPDGRYLGIQAAQTWTEQEIHVYDRELRKVTPLVIGFPARFSIRFLRDKVLLDTNYKANNYRILWSTYDSLFKPLDEWGEFIPEKEFLLQTLRITKSKILVEYLVNASSEVLVFDYDGVEVEKISLPIYSSLAGMVSRKDEEEFFYGVESFVFPKIVYRYDPVTNEYKEYRKTDNPVLPHDYEVKQEWYTSKDGTNVPMFIFHRKEIELNGMNPTVLNGYGGFGTNETPFFMRNWVPWLERGGVIAIANIRGGGEFGDEWHKGGIKENKQNSFDDFIAGAEHLISQKYTCKDNLGIWGGSNGGLLVSAVALQRPDLFTAVCSRVPLTDMTRFHKFGIGLRWIHEYGNPEVREELQKILAWSPYHNVKEGKTYPSFLFTTANKDTRVDSLHARKMTAILQEVSTENDVFLLTEMEAGHGPGKPIIMKVENQAFTLSFFAKKLGLEMKNNKQ